MNLHLTHNNHIFEYVINRMRNNGGGNEHIVIYTSNQITEDEKLVKNQHAVYLVYDSDKFWDAIGDMERYDVIYIHFLSDKMADFISQIPDNKKVVIVFWGGGVFSLPSFRKNLYKSAASEYINLTREKFKVAFKPWNLYREIKAWNFRRNGVKKKINALKRANYIAHYLEEDIDLIKLEIELDAEYVPFHYGGMLEYIENFDSSNIQFEAGSILLGNSADPSNNHVELIDLISEFNIDFIKVTVPLSYSGENEYVEMVKKFGSSMLGSVFNPKTNYLELNQYNKMISSCPVAIFGHLRSQAAGNALTCIVNGSKVFMFEQSTLFRFLKRIGLIIFSIDSDLKEEELIKSLSARQKERNFEIVNRYFGAQSIRVSYTNLFNLENAKLLTS
jgi:dTDP-N-acetylfucosamine:lipid II N-acetylfucosaminyltransferase